ncbi:MAG: hypothetical protein L0215_16480 [Gemmataceae bacterium]|nr:hypothetical protein [Gemmataceae bacterium]
MSVKRFALVSGLASLLFASAASAQVFVRAPFVRVQVGGPGVYVRAPFVNMFVPSYYPPPSGPVYLAPQSRLFVPPTQTEPPVVQPDAKPPQPVPGEAPPAPLPQANGAMTLEQFAKSFQAKPGNYEVTLLNPVNNQPTTVRFTLLDGSPRRVHVRRNEIEFDYGIRRFVRIQFDLDGAIVVAR